MFAVKGWALDASSLKPQVDDGTSSRNRKRKRGVEGEPKPAKKEDVGELWDKHIEGKVAKKKKEKRKEKKRPKVADESGVGADVSEPGVASNGRPATRQDEVPNSTVDRKSKKNKRKDVSGDSNAGKVNQETVKSSKADSHPKEPPAPPPLPSGAKLTPMQAAMRQKLVSARFRHLNQTLYTAPSATALELFDQNPEMFEDYHAGFRQQVGVWPQNPIDAFVSTVQARGKVKPPSFKDKRGKDGPPTTTGENAGSIHALPRTHGIAIIADLGCGDARLAQTLKEGGDTTKLNLKVQSFDLHSPSPLVTKADISSLPLADNSVDVAIFCLALMGTNWISFIEEAYRILHWKGELWIAEIKSRFGRVGRAGKPVEHSVGSKKKQAALQKARDAKQQEVVEVDEQTALRTEVDGVETKHEETDVSAFVDVLRRRGFVLKDGDKSVDLSNRMFVKMEFVKAASPTKGKGVEKAAQAGASKLSNKKFVEKATEDVASEDEAKVLKPCLYKIR